MDVQKHVENRTWAFGALDDLRAFLGDADFEGEVAAEQPVIEARRKELKEGKYRVVFLGAFNVGKSALINAFLGDAYLPTILEECTTKLTHVVKGDETQTLLRLSEEYTHIERDSLAKLMDTCGVAVKIKEGDTRRELILAYTTGAAHDVVTSLQALVTVFSEEDFPQIKSLREKLDEIVVSLPSNLLQDDIALLDTPGVHSISETKEKITESVIPNCHLVVYMVDSQNAGNVQNREFIETVYRERNRKVFFVINKADQLNPDEIDLTARRGPARDLVRSIADIVQTPELFFISSLYALVGAQLRQGRLALDDIDKNHKIKVPFSVQRELLKADNPEQSFGDYLVEESNFNALKSRLLDYLYTENREGAIVTSVCRFIDDRAYTFSRPMETKLAIARDHPRMAELKRERDQINRELGQNRERAQEVQEEYTVSTDGSGVEDAPHPGYSAFLDARLAESAISERVLRPLGEWLDKSENLKKAKQSGYDALTTELENTLDAFLHEVYEAANQEVRTVESRARDKMGAVAGAVSAPEPWHVEAARAPIGVVRASLAGSYFGFAVVGALVGGAIGAGAWYGLTEGAGIDVNGAVAQAAASLLKGQAATSAALGAGACVAAGAVVGLAAGLIARAATAASAVRGVLDRTIENKVKDILVRGVSGAKTYAAVKEQVKKALEERKSKFRAYVDSAFEQNVLDLNTHLNQVVTEEEKIRREQAAIIARLEPKVERLTSVRRKAQEIVSENTTKAN